MCSTATGEPQLLALSGKRTRFRLGRLYSPADYPESLIGLFGVTWEYPNCEPPAYLQQLSPELYEEESRRKSLRNHELT